MSERRGGDLGNPEVWSIPRPHPLIQPFRYLAYFAMLAVVLVLQGPTGPEWPGPRRMGKRLERLARGGEEQLPCVIIGRSGWCPALPDFNTIRLSASEAISTLGRDRPIPLDGLTPVALHRPRAKPGAPKTPRSFWLLDLDGEGGRGTIAASLRDLALIAAVAKWPPPPELVM